MIDWRRRFDECRVAIMLLSRLPVGQLGGEPPSLKDAAWAFPLVGIPVGLLAWLVFQGGMSAGLPQSMAAIAVLAGSAMVTGALHHDGLADFADGIFGGHTVERRLEIMRDSRIGSYGVLALMLMLATIGTAIAEADRSILTALVFVQIAVASRVFMLLALCSLAPARSDGLGRSSATPNFSSCLTGTIVCALVCVALGWVGLSILVAMAFSTILVGAIASRKIGGQTGDVLGAVALSAEVAGWMALTLTATG